MRIVGYWSIGGHRFGVLIFAFKCLQISLAEKYSTDVVARAEKVLGISRLSKLKQIALDIFRVRLWQKII